MEKPAKFIQLNKKQSLFTPLRFIILGYIGIILIGTLFICFPFSNTDGRWMNFTDAIFIVTSAVSVTGLTVVNCAIQFSVFGKIILLILIQVGGLGFMTVTTIMLLVLGKKITLKERIALEETLSSNKMSGLIKLIIKITLMTFTIEFIGAVLLSIRFIPQYGFYEGIFNSVFHSISAFCGAGIDIISIEGTSLSAFKTDYFICIVFSILMMAGSFGYVALFDIFKSRSIRKLSIYTKVVILMNFIVIVISISIFFISEGLNSVTLRGVSFFEKFIYSFFQASARTTGFSIIDQSLLSSSSKFIIMINMLIGGSPASAAGGLKVTTIFILFAAALSGISGKSEVVTFKRTIPQKTIMKAIGMIFLMGFIIIVSTITISLVQNELEISDIIFEVISAANNTGLSIGLTSQLNNFNKYVIIITMFIGRVGLLTLTRGIFAMNNKHINLKYPEIEIMI